MTSKDKLERKLTRGQSVYITVCQDEGLGSYTVIAARG